MGRLKKIIEYEGQYFQESSLFSKKIKYPLSDLVNYFEIFDKPLIFYEYINKLIPRQTKKKENLSFGNVSK